MATPPLPYNPSIDNPPLTPQPIRQDPDVPDAVPIDPKPALQSPRRNSCELAFTASLWLV